MTKWAKISSVTLPHGVNGLLKVIPEAGVLGAPSTNNCNP